MDLQQVLDQKNEFLKVNPQATEGMLNTYLVDVLSQAKDKLDETELMKQLSVLLTGILIKQDQELNAKQKSEWIIDGLFQCFHMQFNINQSDKNLISNILSLSKNQDNIINILKQSKSEINAVIKNTNKIIENTKHQINYKSQEFSVFIANLIAFSDLKELSFKDTQAEQVMFRTLTALNNRMQKDCKEIIENFTRQQEQIKEIIEN